MPEYSEIIAGQSAQAATRWVAGAIRKPRQVSTEGLPEPERPALKELERMVRERGGGQILDEQSGEPVADPSGPLFCPDGMFDRVEDREPAKLVLRSALQAPRPVHVLLRGSPASGKSDLLRCCAEQIPRARYAVGGMTTPSGMVQHLLERPGTSLLVIDELDKVRDASDYAALYELMESGQVPVMKHDQTELVRWRGRVFAAANDTERIPSALISRFRVVELADYTPEQLLHVNRVVAEREGVSAKRAAQIARLTSSRGSDPRDARDLARLAGEDGELEGLLEHSSSPKAGKGR